MPVVFHIRLVFTKEYIEYSDFTSVDCIEKLLYQNIFGQKWGEIGTHPALFVVVVREVPLVESAVAQAEVVGRLDQVVQRLAASSLLLKVSAARKNRLPLIQLSRIVSLLF